jgi:hypothetical protein
MSETEGGQTDPDGTADKQTTQTHTTQMHTISRTSRRHRRQREELYKATRRRQYRRQADSYKATSRYNQKISTARSEDTICTIRATNSNERKNERSNTIALSIVNPPTHSCCAMPRFIGATPPAPVTSWPCHRHGAETRSTRATAHEQTRNAKRKAPGEG